MSPSFRSILGWLRAGYPQGVPQEDYIALLGVLQRHLTEPEIVTLVERLRSHRGAEPLSQGQIRAAAEILLKGHATEDDIRRVEVRLSASGWSAPDEATPDAQLCGPARSVGPMALGVELPASRPKANSGQVASYLPVED